MNDTYGHSCGDELLELNGTRLIDALAAARKILRSFEMPFHLDGPEAPASVTGFIELADREMYVVKRNGGRGIKMACPSSSGDRAVLRTAANA